MKVVIAGILFSSLVLAACGTNQTDQINNQQPLVKQDNPVEIQKESTVDTSSGMAMNEGDSKESGELSVVESLNSDKVMDASTDNPMIKDNGIQTEVKQDNEEKAAIAMEDIKKEATVQKDEIKKQIVEPKS